MPKKTAGSKIKDPLLYSLQLIEELNLKAMDLRVVANFLRQQGMDLFNQPNVKGWVGGRSWLTSQIFLQRNNAADALCAGKRIPGKHFRDQQGNKIDPPKAKINWNKKYKQQAILKSFADRLLFQVDDDMQANMEAVLKHDFDPQSEYADQTILRLFNYIVKTPEFQLI